jgi:hypothetical protein
MNEVADERGLRSGEAAETVARRRRARARAALLRALADIETFGATVLGMPLRPYQAEVARAALDSIDRRDGHSLTVMMPRQSGKNQPWIGHLRPCPHGSCQPRSSRPRPAPGRPGLRACPLVTDRA